LSERPVTPLPVRLDHAQRTAASILANGVARAYGFRQTDDFKDACPKCDGDGCHACWWTGEKSKVVTV
jgi:hypothetical protein